MMMDLYKGLATAPQAPGKPLVFAFHGTGGNESQFFELAQSMVPGAGVISPRGDVSEMGAARFFKRTGEGVYDMDDLAERTDKMIRFVEGHKAEHPDSPVYGFGYSNGANILASVAFKRPDLFDRLGLLHPLVTWDLQPTPALENKKVLVTAGRNDPITPWPQTEKLIEWIGSQGAYLVTGIHEGGHELQPGEINSLARLFAD